MNRFDDAQGSGPDSVRTATEPGGQEAERAQAVAADALAEQEGEALAVAHITGGVPGKFRHGAYTVLSGREDGRSAVARRMRRLAERIAVDMGFDNFNGMPAVRQAAVMQFCRTLAADAMWTAFLVNGRLPDKFWDLVSLIHKYVGLLGMDRVLKDARPLDLPAYLAQRSVPAISKPCVPGQLVSRTSPPAASAFAACGRPQRFASLSRVRGELKWRSR